MESRVKAAFCSHYPVFIVCVDVLLHVRAGYLRDDFWPCQGRFRGLHRQCHDDREESGHRAARTVTSNSSGDFVVPNMPPETYDITVEDKGFKKLETNGMVLSAADKFNAGEFELAPGAAAESVTVTADAGQMQLQSNSGERSDVVTSKQLNDVALNGRNVLDYLKLVPGVSGMVDGHASGTGGLDSYNINGTRANEHEFTIDGASNVDTGNNGGTHVTLNPDAIEEVKVLTSNYQAEFGKAAGGQIALTTKGGTNSVARRWPILPSQRRPECQRMVQQEERIAEQRNPTRRTFIATTTSDTRLADQSRRTSSSFSGARNSTGN